MSKPHLSQEYLEAGTLKGIVQGILSEKKIAGALVQIGNRTVDGHKQYYVSVAAEGALPEDIRQRVKEAYQARMGVEPTVEIELNGAERAAAMGGR